MANSRSALKRVRQTRTRTAENRAIESRIKSARKVALAVLDSGDAEAIDRALRTLFSAADRAVKRGVVHRNFVRRMRAKFATKLAAPS